MTDLTPNSIYDGPRLAQPDEVWNFHRGDGLERALCLANIWMARHPAEVVSLHAAGETVTLTLGERAVSFVSDKGLTYEGVLNPPLKSLNNS